MIVDDGILVWHWVDEVPLNQLLPFLEPYLERLKITEYRKFVSWLNGVLHSDVGLRISVHIEIPIDEYLQFRFELQTQNREVIEHIGYGIISNDDDLGDIGCSTVSIPDNDY